MLLGCCHCEGENEPPSNPSDSDPPNSETDASSESESVDGRGPCNACIGGVSPLTIVLNTTKVAGASAPNCNTQYTGAFLLKKTDPLVPGPGATSPTFPGGQNGCLFYSDELALNWGSGTPCTDSANPAGRRFKLQLTATDIGGSFRYAATLLIQYWATGVGAGFTQAYSFTQDDISLPLDNALNCFSTITLTSGESSGTLTALGLPRTVTIGPG